jgi:hypothetical protein
VAVRVVLAPGRTDFDVVREIKLAS